MNDRDLSRIEALIRSHAYPAGQHPSHAGVEQTPPRSPFTIAISREVGAMGNGVATEVGRRLDWPVYDRNILDKIAARLRRPPSHVQDIDERQGSWLGECFSSLLDHDHFVSSGAYFEHLLAVLRGLGSAGRCVIVGRGANFILPAETTLRIRMVAQTEDRARVAARRLGLSAQEAASYVETAERQRLAFLKAHFEEDPTDPHHYDLVLNMSRLSVDDAADLVIETLYRLDKCGEPAAGTWAPGHGPSRQHEDSDRREANKTGCIIRG